MEIISNLNIDVIMCYKDIFNFKYFKKNIGGFIIIGLIIFESICHIYYYLISHDKIVRYIYLLTESFISFKEKKVNSKDKLYYPPKKKETKIKKIKNRINIEIKSKNKINNLINIHKYSIN